MLHVLKLATCVSVKSEVEEMGETTISDILNLDCSTHFDH